MSRERSRNRKKELDVVSDYEARIEHEANRPRIGPLVPMNRKQEFLIRQMEEKRLVFVSGPAGTGKTFITASFAAEALLKGEFRRIIISRPMVGCDEDWGALPGDETQKYHPWLGPILDVLHGKIGKKRVESFIRAGIIVAKPLMLMRGDTFRDSIVILDEAQNTTKAQMKMFLTRIGEGSTVIVDGDAEQTDLPESKGNGLVDASWRLRESPLVGFVSFSIDDIVRDPLVREISKAYRK